MREELDIDYHRQQYAALIAAGNKELAAHFTHQALQNHSLVVKNALNDTQTSAVLTANNLSTQAKYYIFYGAARRLGMMRVSYCDILRCIATDRTEPLSSDEVAAVERDLNIIISMSVVCWTTMRGASTTKLRQTKRESSLLNKSDCSPGSSWLIPT